MRPASVPNHANQPQVILYSPDPIDQWLSQPSIQPPTTKT